MTKELVQFPPSVWWWMGDPLGGGWCRGEGGVIGRGVATSRSLHHWCVVVVSFFGGGEVSGQCALGRGALGEGSRAQTVLSVQPALAAAGGKQASNLSHGLCRECHKDTACRVTGDVSTIGKWPGRWFLSCNTILVQCLAVGCSSRFVNHSRCNALAVVHHHAVLHSDGLPASCAASPPVQLPRLLQCFW